MEEFVATAPGRICLFGEHQDYLGQPVIAAAIGFRLCINVTVEPEILNRYRIIMPDTNAEELINTAMPLDYRHEKDYLRAAMKVLREEGYELPHALTAVVSSAIPIAAGTSSSSAFCDAWTAALMYCARPDIVPDPGKVAAYSHRSEVIEFNEPGGMMDQLSIAYGGICHIDFAAGNKVTRLAARPEGLVLGDSRQPKDTQAILSRVRGTAERALEKLPDIDLKTTPIDEVREADLSSLTAEERKVLLGNFRNRDILKEALDLLSLQPCDPARLGALLTEHHRILRDAMKISTPRIETMMDAALGAGALGGKINGSGGGGCLFVLAPGREEAVAKAMEAAGGRAWPVKIGDGVRIMPL